jgi:DNA repair exonuclease SbcCD nuclease subunit
MAAGDEQRADKGTGSTILSTARGGAGRRRTGAPIASAADGRSPKTFAKGGSARAPMDESFSFLHTGDLHLDTPFVGLSGSAPEPIAARLRVATLRVWDRIVDLALARRVDFVVVAGDVFESETRSLIAQLAFADGLVRLSDAGIAVAVVTGNHDPLSAWEATVDWPRLAHRFDSDAVGSLPILREGHEIARVFGMSYREKAERADLASRFRREPDTPFAVGLLHATIGIQDRHERYGPTTEEVLVASGMDYWALGHIHARRVVRIAEPCVVYPGNPQGRDPGETEPRGVAIVTVEPGTAPQVEFVDIDVVRWVIVRIDTAPIASMNNLRDAIRAELTQHRDLTGRSIVARVELTGFTHLHDELRRAAVAKDLVQTLRDFYPPDADLFVWLESLRDETRSDTETAYARGADFVAELDALVEASWARLRDEEQAPAVGQNGVFNLAHFAADLFDNDRFRRAMEAELTPDSQALADALAEARTLVLDRLRATG